MQTLFRNWDSKKLLSSAPDFWFLAILLLGWVDSIAAALSGKWSTVDMVLGVALLTVTALLIKQLFNRKVGISFVLGFIFLIGSIVLSMALVSELSEFTVLSEPRAIQLLLGGILLVGSSLAMSVMMMIRHTCGGKCS